MCSWHVKFTVSLFGTVNRQGTGIAGEVKNELYIGMHPGIFEQVISPLTEDFLKHMGGYQSNEIKGAVCELQVGFEFSDKSTGGFGWKYGTESQGPPQELREVVTKAIELTDPIYDEILKKHAEDSKQE